MTPEVGDMELEKMKYAELQKLAKVAGVKANMKVDKLVKALREHYSSSPEQNAESQEAKSAELPSVSDESADSDDKESDAEPQKAATKRGKRRAAPKGKGRKAKTERKNVEKMPKQSSRDVNTPTIKSAVKTGTPRMVGVRNATPHRGTPKQTVHAKATPKGATPQRGTLKQRTTLTPLRRNTPTVAKTPARTPNKVTGTQQGNSTRKVLNARRSKSLTPGKLNGSSKKTSSVVDANASENVAVNPGNTQIPRFAAFLAKKKAAAAITNTDKNPITPGNKDWTKIHQRNFDKMDSLDVYLEKKRKRVESVNDSVKRARLTMETAKESCNKLQNHKTPDFKKVSKTSVVKKRSIGGAAPFQSPVGQSGKRKSPFKVVSSSQMNVVRDRKPNQEIKSDTPRFGNGKVGDSIAKSIKKAIEGKNRKELVTSASADTLTNGRDTRTSSKKPPASRKSIGQSGYAPAGRKSIGTPFKFNMNGSICTNFGGLNQTIGDAQSAKKATFDIKASLSKPVSWKMHKGTLKTFSGKPGTAANPNIKVPKLKTREDRRSEMTGNRNNQKSKQQMHRRGIDV